ncbi:MAG: glutamate--tRNA ligase [Acidobacteria bacterium]|nr:glutamate--tRNA ligase [Acidobacteriota bacterium]
MSAMLRDDGPVRVRFAPSPTGSLHVGNVRTALYNWLFARGRWGAFVLRIEDTDVERNEAGAEARIYEDLRWLGLDWDEGPDRGGPLGPYRQSDRAAHYADAGAKLLAAGDAYRCFCPVGAIEAERASQRAAGLPPRYSGRCRGVAAGESGRRAAAGEPFALRFRVPEGNIAFIDAVRGRVEFPWEQIGDPILVRSDARPAYNFAVVVDDIAMRITHVVRGEDHLSNTPRQILVYRALGHEPPAFAHLSMIVGPDGARLHKRHGSVSVAQFREEGIVAQALVNYLALLGWSHPSGEEILTLDALTSSFTLDRVSGSAATFDPKKLAFLNAHHIRTMDPGRLLDLARPFLAAGGLKAGGEDSAGRPAGDPDVEAWWARAVAVAAGQMETLRDAPGAVEFLFRSAGGSAPDPVEAAVVATFEKLASGENLAMPGVFRGCAVAAGKATGRKGRELFHPLRLALTGKESGPELDRIVPLIEEGGRLGIRPAVPGCVERARGWREGRGWGSAT